MKAATNGLPVVNNSNQLLSLAEQAISERFRGIGPGYDNSVAIGQFQNETFVVHICKGTEASPPVITLSYGNHELSGFAQIPGANRVLPPLSNAFEAELSGLFNPKRSTSSAKRSYTSPNWEAIA